MDDGEIIPLDLAGLLSFVKYRVLNERTNFMIAEIWAHDERKERKNPIVLAISSALERKALKLAILMILGRFFARIWLQSGKSNDRKN